MFDSNDVMKQAPPTQGMYMARPVTMMTTALLTAAVAAAASVLPQLVSSNSGSPPPPSVAAVASQPLALPSTAPAPNNTPAPTGSGPQALGGGLTTATLTSALSGQGNANFVNLLPNATLTFRPANREYVGHLPLRSTSGCARQLTAELMGLQDRNGAKLTAQLTTPKPEDLALPAFGLVNVTLRLSPPESVAGGGGVSAGAGDTGDRRALLPAGGWIRLLATPRPEEPCKPEPGDKSKEPQDPGYMYVTVVVPDTPPMWNFNAGRRHIPAGFPSRMLV